MKENYSIGEVSSMYDLSPETLRFYEKKGLLSPKRKENGYRVYSLEDIWKLNLIKGMRKLDFSIQRISDYIHNRSIDKEWSLIQEELQLIEGEIQPLLRQKEYLEKRLETLENLQGLRGFGQVVYRDYPRRKIALMESKLSKDEEIDLAFRKIESKNDRDFFFFSNKVPGVIVSSQDLSQGIFTNYQSAFYILEESDENYNASLPQGTYACLYYKGSYSQAGKWYGKILGDIRSKGYQYREPILEIYRMDIHGTSKEEEYITEIQIYVEGDQAGEK